MDDRHFRYITKLEINKSLVLASDLFIFNFVRYVFVEALSYTRRLSQIWPHVREESRVFKKKKILPSFVWRPAAGSCSLNMANWNMFPSKYGDMRSFKIN